MLDDYHWKVHKHGPDQQAATVESLLYLYFFYCCFRGTFADYGEHTPVLFPEDIRASELTADDFLEVFPKIRGLFRAKEGRKMLEFFTGKLIKTKLIDYAD